MMTSKSDHEDPPCLRLLKFPTTWDPTTVTEIHVSLRPEWSQFMRRFSLGSQPSDSSATPLTSNVQRSRRRITEPIRLSQPQQFLASLRALGTTTTLLVTTPSKGPSKAQQEMETSLQLLEQEGPGYLAEDSESTAYTLYKEYLNNYQTEQLDTNDDLELDMIPYLQLDASAVPVNSYDTTDSQRLLLLGQLPTHNNYNNDKDNSDNLMAQFATDCSRMAKRLDSAFDSWRSNSPNNMDESWRSLWTPTTPPCSTTGEQLHHASCPDRLDIASTTDACAVDNAIEELNDETEPTLSINDKAFTTTSTTNHYQHNQQILPTEYDNAQAQFHNVFHEFWHYYCSAITQLRTQGIQEEIILTENRTCGSHNNNNDNNNNKQHQYLFLPSSSNSFQEDESLFFPLNVYREFWHYYPAAIQEGIRNSSLHGM
ncbi:expressed unknown protein [Seminavis robusta]|uniref:Uncharacterized protein n=1 Tax=Seminavis robusta TaxID=568900 RepID=A0A9N8EZM3_9STRA|nr:expressed unknown protein [Seminavis robusta]|eukprot:Sro3184_g344850.1 n/a (427) ;mRNA; f:3853-5133